MGTNNEDPYLLLSYDHSGLTLVTTSLTARNYQSWSRSVRMVLATKSKLGFITRSIVQPEEDYKEYEHWFKVDALVQVWIVNSIARELADAIMYSPSTSTLWKTLQKRFGESNGPLIYQLKREIATAHQGDSSVVFYYTRLNKLWDELAVIVPILECKSGTQKVLQEWASLDRLMQFLLGLSDNFEQARGQILAMEPLSNVDKAYNMIIGVEKQKEMSKMLGFSPTPNTALFSDTKPPL